MFASFKSFLALAPDYGEEYRTQMAKYDEQMVMLDGIEKALKAKQDHLIRHLERCHDAYDQAMLDIAKMDVQEFLRDDIPDKIVELHVCIQKMKGFIEDGHNRLEEVSNARSANIREQQALNAKRFALLDDYRKKTDLKAA